MTAPTDPTPVPPLVEPRQREWNPTPAEAADDDRRYWADRDFDTEPDDPSDHYNY